MTTPLAFRQNATFNHVIHENVFIVSTVSEVVDPDDAYRYLSRITVHRALVTPPGSAGESGSSSVWRTTQHCR